MWEKSMMANGIFCILMGYYTSQRTRRGYCTGLFPGDMGTSFASWVFILVLIPWVWEKSGKSDKKIDGKYICHFKGNIYLKTKETQ